METKELIKKYLQINTPDYKGVYLEYYELNGSLIRIQWGYETDSGFYLGGQKMDVDLLDFIVWLFNQK